MFPVYHIVDLREDKRRKFELEINNRELSPELLREMYKAIQEKSVRRAARAFKRETDSNVIVHNLAVISTEALVSISKV